jgi:mono/diheme cytochrome c family protein
MKVLLPATLLILWSAAAAPAALAQDAPDGKALYEKDCRACHGPRGTPPRAMARQMSVPVLDSAYLAQRTDEQLIRVMKEGGKNMKPTKLSAAEMALVGAYLRQLVSSKATTP